MDKAVDDFRKALVATRTGRASAQMLDGVTVEAYGSQMPLNQMSTVHAPEPPRLAQVVIAQQNIAINSRILTGAVSLGTWPVEAAGVHPVLRTDSWGAPGGG